MYVCNLGNLPQEKFIKAQRSNNQINGKKGWRHHNSLPFSPIFPHYPGYAQPKDKTCNFRRGEVFLKGSEFAGTREWDTLIRRQCFWILLSRFPLVQRTPPRPRKWYPPLVGVPYLVYGTAAAHRCRGWGRGPSLLSLPLLLPQRFPRQTSPGVALGRRSLRFRERINFALLLSRQPNLL